MQVLGFTLPCCPMAYKSAQPPGEKPGSVCHTSLKIRTPFDHSWSLSWGRWLCQDVMFINANKKYKKWRESQSLWIGMWSDKSWHILTKETLFKWCYRRWKNVNKIFLMTLLRYITYTIKFTLIILIYFRWETSTLRNGVTVWSKFS